MKKILEFLQERDGKFSSKRLMSFLVTFAVIADYIHAVFATEQGIWQPTWQTVSFVLIVLGYQQAIEIIRK